MSDERTGPPRSADRKLKLGTAPTTPRIPVRKMKEEPPRERRAAGNPVQNPTPKVQVLRCGAINLNGKMLELGSDRKYASNATATVESAASARQRMTATRVVGGFALFGPLGAIVGSMSKKDMTRVFVIVEFNDGTVWTEDVPVRAEASARQFVGAINSIN